jgi:hypothetical protein
MSQVLQVILRGVLILLIVLCPALLVPVISPEVGQAVTLLALLAAFVVITEYSAPYPGLIEFRDAKPYNRMRFILLGVIVLALALLQRDLFLTPEVAGPLARVAVALGNMLSFSFSPVTLLVTALPAGLPAAHLANVTVSAALALVIALLGLGVFLCGLAAGYWPRRNAIFNVWVNLPNFDPTKGVDVVQRLQRDGQINMAVGVILPFSLPALLHLSSFLVQPVTLQIPLALVWGVALWAFIPISLIMRGISMYRIGQMIRTQRRRIAEAEEAVPLPPQSAYSS